MLVIIFEPRLFSLDGCGNEQFTNGNNNVLLEEDEDNGDKKEE